MELVWVVWFIFGLFAGVIVGGMDEGESDNDSDMRVYIPSRDRNRRGDNGSTESVETEEAVNGLQNLRMALSSQEKRWLDHVCNCALKERGTKDDRKAGVKSDAGVHQEHREQKSMKGERE